jgi:hypothetical protein
MVYSKTEQLAKVAHLKTQLESVIAAHVNPDSLPGVALHAKPLVKILERAKFAEDTGAEIAQRTADFLTALDAWESFQPTSTRLKVRHAREALNESIARAALTFLA